MIYMLPAICVHDFALHHRINGCVVWYCDPSVNCFNLAKKARSRMAVGLDWMCCAEKMLGMMGLISVWLSPILYWVEVLGMFCWDVRFWSSWSLWCCVGVGVNFWVSRPRWDWKAVYYRSLLLSKRQSEVSTDKKSLKAFFYGAWIYRFA